MRFSARQHRGHALRRAPTARGERPAQGLPRFLGGGKPLPEDMQEDFAQAGAGDLSSVRVHDDREADGFARMHSARALTVGQDIFFKSGNYQPAQGEGRELIAHEVAHTLQQSRFGTRRDANAREDSAQLENEADIASGDLLAGRAPDVSAASAPSVQCDPDPEARTRPKTAAQAAALKPPAYTDYFDQVVPDILEAMEGNSDLPPDRALWLITQSYGEQSPLQVHKDKSVSNYLPSEHHNRLFNEQAEVEEDPVTHEKTTKPGQDYPGAHIYDLPQKEFLNGKWVDTTSPTFGYDTTTDSARHHLDLLKKKRPGVYDALSKGNSFEGFVDALHDSGYATEPAYVERLKGLKNQVQLQVSNYLKYRIPEMRERLPRMEAYRDMLLDTLIEWQERQATEDDPVGEIANQIESLQGMIVGIEDEIERVNADLGRMENFATSIHVKMPAAAAE